MAKPMTDITPFFAEQGRLFVLLARKAPVAVILRTGPAKWWRLIRWDLRKDEFEAGQWFHGSLYPAKCDLSPDGKLLAYFAGKFRPQSVANGYGWTYTAVSRPPYFTALALWPDDSTWGGGGVFAGNKDLRLRSSGAHHPDHPPGPLRVSGFAERPEPCWRAGWVAVADTDRPKLIASWRKTAADLTLDRTVTGGVWDPYPAREPAVFSIYRNQKLAACFEAHWADFDASGRLLASAGPKLFRGALSRKQELEWRELASFSAEKPARMVAPDWAQRW